jgi:transketolase
LAWRVSGLLTESKQLYGKPLITGAIGVKDRFGDSGSPWEMVKELEVSAEHIAQKAVELMKVKKKPAGGPDTQGYGAGNICWGLTEA